MKVRRRDWGGRQDDGGMIKGWRDGRRLLELQQGRDGGLKVGRCCGWMRVNGGMMEGGWWRLRRRQFQFHKLAASGGTTRRRRK